MPLRYLPNASFDPQTAEVMREAFNSAWEALKASGDPQLVDAKAEWARETLALRIIDRAQRGERDVERLQLDAIAHLANSKMEKRA
jgi:hypothetical protein